jgi:hypothetical protein
MHREAFHCRVLVSTIINDRGISHHDYSLEDEGG